MLAVIGLRPQKITIYDYRAGGYSRARHEDLAVDRRAELYPTR